MEIGTAKLALKPIDWTKFRTVAVAAQRLGVHPNHLARRCRTEWAAQGLAVCVVPPEGGPARWFIHQGADPVLMDGPMGELHEWPTLEGETQEDRELAHWKVEQVEALRRLRVSAKRGAMRDLEHELVEEIRAKYPGRQISRSTLRRWDQVYKGPADLAKLVDRRGGDRSRTSPEAWAAFKDLYLHQNRPSAAECWRMVRDLAEENRWLWVSESQMNRQLPRMIPAEVQLAAQDPKTLRGQLAPYIRLESSSAGAGQLWYGDHKQLDLICRFGDQLIRPWLTAWLDFPTRRLTGWTLGRVPNSWSILCALRKGLLEERNMGGPRHVHIDNGKDYDCYTLHGRTKVQRRTIRPAVKEEQARGLLKNLGITASFARPFNPMGKARLETWFGGNLAGFCKRFDTYTGESTEAKPERLAEVLARPALIPTFEAVMERLGNFIAGYNANPEHAIDDLVEDGQRLSPDQAMERWCESRRVMARPEALHLLLQQWHKPVTVGRNGITLNIVGRAVSYGQFEPALSPFKALRKADRRPLLASYDPEDLASIRVYTERYEYVCTATMNQLGRMVALDPIAQEDVAELNRQKSAYLRAQRHVAERSLTEQFTTEERLVEIAADRAVAQRPTAPRAVAMRIVQTPVDDAVRDVQREQVRQAAGGESAPLPEIKRGLPSLAKLRETIQPRPREQAPRDLLAKLRSQNEPW